MTRLTLIIPALVALLVSGPAWGAEILAPAVHQTGDGHIPRISIEGPIEKGDYEKFRGIVRNTGGQYTGIVLASPGGDLIEAMKIGSLIRRMRFWTKAPFDLYEGANQLLTFGIKDVKNRTCSSACFFILVAGVRRIGSEIGIHRPYLPSERYREIGADDAISAAKKIRQISQKYLIEMNVPLELIDRMFNVPSGKTEMIPYKEAMSLFGGLIPELEDWVVAKCPGLTPIEQSLHRAIVDKHIFNKDKPLSAYDEEMSLKLGEKRSVKWECRKRTVNLMGCRGWMREFNKPETDVAIYCKDFL